jgi:lysophospholipase L1-like esterase
MIQQLSYVIGSFIAIPLLPILAYLGKQVRKNIPELPEASENIQGQIHGNFEKIELLTIGESSIAGVGVTDHKYAITGQIAKRLHELTDKTINWQVLAQNGYTAQRVNEILINRIPNKPFDIIVIGMGGNDTFKLNSPLTFKRNMIKMIDSIKSRQPQAKIVIINMPPIADFPAFPPLIKFFFVNLVNLHGAVIKDIPLNYKNVFYINETIHLDDYLKATNYSYTSTDFFSDGVHPSALTYSVWGKNVAEFIISSYPTPQYL